MNLRKVCLPPPWYPRNPAKINEFLVNYTASRPGGPVIAAVAPHAGWYYSGAIAAQAVAALANPVSAEEARAAETIAVIGGHLPRGGPALFATEDEVETPLGNMETDKELLETFIKGLQALPGFEIAQDVYRDNTVEVLLPMVRFFFPKARLLWVRLPADKHSFDAGSVLARSAASLGRKLLVLGSTDLTHYGQNYQFAPRGEGKEALRWVKTVNDRRFIDAVEAGDPGAVLERAEREYSACSAGAVLGAMGYAHAVRTAGGAGTAANGDRAAAKDSKATGSGAAKGSGGQLLTYGTSADADPGGEIPDSFVGYGAFIWTK